MRQPDIVAVADCHDQPSDLAPLCGHDTVLGEMGPQRVDGLGALAHEHVADRQLHQAGPLPLGFGRHKALGRARYRLADRLGTCRVGYSFLPSIIERMRMAIASIAKGLVRTAMPGPSCPLLRIAFSA